jgi:hypothetical protein
MRLEGRGAQSWLDDSRGEAKLRPAPIGWGDATGPRRSAIKEAKTPKKRGELRDDGDRLVLVVRPMKKRIATEWYALYYRDDKRRFTKIGVHSTKSLQGARDLPQ